jgi:hypothetical protein
MRRARRDRPTNNQMSLLGMWSHNFGRSIGWDGEYERVIGDDAANELLRRPYRGPGVYPGLS